MERGVIDILAARSVPLGLDDREAEARLARFGPNALPEPPPERLWRQFLAQLVDPLILTLLVSAGIAAAVGVSASQAGVLSRFGDAVAILLIVVMNAVLGVHQERRASRALAALRSMTAPRARVRRRGRILSIDARQVVPGDVLLLEAGDAIVADGLVVESNALATQEAALTGESASVFKRAAGDDRDVDGETRVSAGTQVVAGNGVAVVTATGIHGQLGRIGELMRSIDVSRTPLQERLDAFGHLILRLCLALAAVLFAWGLWDGGRPLAQLLLEAVSLAVAAIPEGLPAITTIALALGMTRMARQGAIVRRLSAVETLGAASAICSDKTGTLTRNQMQVTRVYDGQDIVDAEALVAPLLLEACVSSVIRETDPMEAALVELGRSRGVDVDALRNARTVVYERPFDASRKRSSVLRANPGIRCRSAGSGEFGAPRLDPGDAVMYVKGAPETTLPLCSRAARGDLDDATRERIVAAAERMAGEGLRVLLVACKYLARASGGGSPAEERVSPSFPDGEDGEGDLVFLGLVGLLDPPRPEAAASIAACRVAGIVPIMITGDHPSTGAAIARTLGIYDASSTSMTGDELEELSDEALADRVDRVRVFARTNPAQKLRIVRALKARGHVVAMTGDGVNDAPALREAHIGVAMGRGGTDVAREAADLVLADDNFATIVTAVREGRAIYRNIQKFIFFLLSSNLGLVVAVFAIAFHGGWPLLTPLMILWINLVTNGLPALALGVDPSDEVLMGEPPRPRGERLLQAWDYCAMVLAGTVMGLSAISVYVVAPQTPEGLHQARCMAFCVLALSPLVHAFSCRSRRKSAFSASQWSPVLIVAVALSASIHMLSVVPPPLQSIFHTCALNAGQWAWVGILSFLVLPAMEAAKAMYRVLMHINAPSGVDVRT